MKRSRLEKEKEEIKNRLAEHEAQGSTRFKATMLDGAITEVEKLLTEVLQDFSLQLRAAAFSSLQRPLGMCGASPFPPRHGHSWIRGTGTGGLPS